MQYIDEWSPYIRSIIFSKCKVLREVSLQVYHFAHRISLTTSVASPEVSTYDTFVFVDHTGYLVSCQQAVMARNVVLKAVSGDHNMWVWLDELVIHSNPNTSNCPVNGGHLKGFRYR